MNVILLAGSFMRSASGRGFHAACKLSAFSVFVGTAFLMLTIGVYDSYTDKLETITFSVYPHLLIADLAESKDDAASQDPLARQRRICGRICKGEALDGPAATSKPPTVSRLRQAAAIVQSARGVPWTVELAAPIILDERDFTCRVETGGSWRAARFPLRILGVSPAGGAVTPRIDLFLGRPLVGRLESDPEPVAVISEELAETIFGERAAEGRLLEVLDPRGQAVAVRVLGTFSLGFHAIARNLMITRLDTAQAILGLPDQASYLGVGFADPDDSRGAADGLADRLAEASFGASDWTRLAGDDFNTIRLFRWIIFLVLGMSFVVTGLNIRNTLAILTLERRRQIGVLRALGTRDSLVRRVFLLISLSIGWAGALTGLVAGALLSLQFGRWIDRQMRDFLPVSQVDFTLQGTAMLQIAVLVTLVCAFTALLSVRRALRLDPVACLQEE